MLAKREGKILLGVLALLFIVAVAAALTSSQPEPALAQMPPAMDEPTEEMPPPPGAGRVGPGMGPRPDMRWGMQPPTFSRGTYGGSSVAIAATQDHVYVIRGNTLYQFSARTLKLVNKEELAAPASGSPVFPQVRPEPRNQPAP